MRMDAYPFGDNSAGTARLGIPHSVSGRCEVISNDINSMVIKCFTARKQKPLRLTDKPIFPSRG